MKILAADDSKTVLRAIVVALEDAGHEVTGCSTYADAIREATKAKYDVIVTDYMLGPMNGIKLGRIVGLPTVLIT